MDRDLISLFGVENPVVLVTGSTSPRVGREIAMHLLENGYRVVFHAHHATQEAKEFIFQLRDQKYICSLVTGPIEQEAVVASWVGEILGTFGRIDGLVHSAAVWRPKKLEATSIEDLEFHWRANALGPFFLSKSIGLALSENETGGSIVLIGDWAIERPYVDYAAYFLSKSTIPTLTRTMAVELATRNPKVRVNAVLPGPVLLPAGTDPQLEAAIAQESLLRRSGTAMDVAKACKFLLEQPFVTGSCLPVDGGRSIYGGANSDSQAARH